MKKANEEKKTFFGDEKPKRKYTKQTETTNNVEKPKRKYTRRNIVAIDTKRVSVALPQDPIKAYSLGLAHGALNTFGTLS